MTKAAVHGLDGAPSRSTDLTSDAGSALCCVAYSSLPNMDQSVVCCLAQGGCVRSSACQHPSFLRTLTRPPMLPLCIFDRASKDCCTTHIFAALAFQDQSLLIVYRTEMDARHWRPISPTSFELSSITCPPRFHFFGFRRFPVCYRLAFLQSSDWSTLQRRAFMLQHRGRQHSRVHSRLPPLMIGFSAG